MKEDNEVLSISDPTESVYAEGLETGMCPVAPLSNDIILKERLGLRLEPCKEHDYCHRVIRESDGEELGIIPLIQASAMWKKADFVADDVKKSDLKREKFDKGTKTMEAFIRYHGDLNGRELYLQDFLSIRELDYEELFLEEAKKISDFLYFVIKGDIRETSVAEKRWNKIKNYRHSVKLRESEGGIFTDRDATILEEHGVKRLNDIKKQDIYALKNMFLTMSVAAMPDRINAAYKEDLERRRDKKYKVVPFIFAVLGSLPVAVLSHYYGYTLLKNKPMTAIIILCLAVWLVATTFFIHGIARVRKRRKKRPDYKFFTPGVVKALVPIAMLSFFSIASATVYYERYDDYDQVYYYRVVRDGYAVAGLRDESVIVADIPSYFNGEAVTEIDILAFCSDDLEEVTIPHTVKTIDRGAFSNCKKLVSVGTDNGAVGSVDAIGDYAFSRCEELASVDAVTALLSDVGDGAFRQCKSLTSVTLPSSVTSIRKNMFAGCTSLINFKAYGEVNKIGDNAFKNCPALKVIEFAKPESLKVIGKEAFSGCAALYYVDAVKYANKLGARAFEDCDSLINVEINSEAQEIGKDLFKGCDNIETLSIPYIGKTADKPQKYTYLFDKDSGARNIVLTGGDVSVTKNAFKGCETLVALDASKAKDIGQSAFQNCKNLVGVVIPSGTTEIKRETFSGCVKLSEIVNFDSVVTVRKNAFEDCGAFGMDISAVTVMGDGAFKGCDGITEATLLSVTDMGKGVFEDCKGLTRVSLGANFDVLPAKSFKDCSALTTVYGLDSYKEIGKEAFRGCGLTSLNLGSNLNKIGTKAFYNCDALTELVIPDSVQKIYRYAFGDCGALKYVKTPFLGRTRDSFLVGIRYDFAADSTMETVVLTDTEKILSCTFRGAGSDLTNVVLSDGIKSISGNAFSGVGNLKSLYIPESVTKLSNGCFSGHESLESVNIPSGVTEIPKNAFKDCTSLLTVTGCVGVKSVGKKAFSGCTALIQADIPVVESLGEKCFENCSALTTLNGFENVGSIGKYAFDGCKSLGELVVPTKITSIGQYAFAGSGYTRVVIGNNVTEIGKHAFDGANGITELEISDSVKKIDDNAFANCSGLVNVDISYLTPDSLGKSVFAGCYNLYSVAMPSVGVIPKGFFSGCSRLSAFTFPENLTEVGDEAFKGCKALTSVYLPDSVKTVGKYAFSGCSSLTELRVPEGIETIERKAFDSCTSLTSVELPFLGKTKKSATTGYRYVFGSDTDVKIIALTDTERITSATFRGADALTTVVLNEKVKKIGYQAFYGRDKLESVTIPNSVESIGDRAFAKCDSLTSLTIPDSVTKLGFAVAKHDGSLAYVKFSANVKEIPYKSAYDCPKLTTVAIPEGVETIGVKAFKDSGLTEINLPSSVKKINGKAFKGCSSLESLVLNDGLKTIGVRAFEDCVYLQNAYIPDSVDKMYYKIFNNCDKLYSVVTPFIGYNRKLSKKMSYFGADSIETIKITSAKSIAKKAFEDSYTLRYVYIAGSVTSVGEDAFKYCTNLEVIETSRTVPIDESALPAGCKLVYID